MGKLIKPFLLLLLTVAVFHSWFFPGLLSSYDFPYFSKIMMKDTAIFSYAWGWHVGLDGFAKFFSPYSWVFPFINIPQVILGNILGMEWDIIERVSYFYPLLILLTISPIILFKTLFPKNKFYIFSVLVFSFNTYSLLLAGGQIFLAFAYVLIPLILAVFINIINNINDNQRSKLLYSVIIGVLISLQVMFDPRVCFVTMSAVVLYIFFKIFYLFLNKKSLQNIEIKRIVIDFVFIVLIPGTITVLMHAFWILPTILYGTNPVKSLGASYSTVNAVSFLSFAKLENTITLLHSNWPENIFGKVYFMSSEFLLVPILAYASLFFISKNQNEKVRFYILFFALLGIIGAFLSKGANDPFGGIYLWMFDHVPGFIMFRDPAKWYALVAVSYSVLIPFSIWKIYECLKQHSQFLIKFKVFNFQNLFLLLTILYSLFLIRPALLNQLGGLFKPTSIPTDYTRLEKYLADKPNFFRTLWVPSRQKFGYYSEAHPAISVVSLFNDTNNLNILKKLSDLKTKSALEDASIKYVIIPYDSEEEIFLNDRKYDNKVYLKTIEEIEKIAWLKKIDGFGKIKVFELSNPKGHFYIKNQIVKYQYINPVEYSVSVVNAKKGESIVFTESYDSKWIAKVSDYMQYAKRHGLFNRFVLPKDGDYKITVYYTPQDHVNIGIIISISTLAAVLGILTILVIKRT